MFSKDVNPLIIFSFNVPKPTRGPRCTLSGTSNTSGSQNKLVLIRHSWHGIA